MNTWFGPPNPYAAPGARAAYPPSYPSSHPPPIAAGPNAMTVLYTPNQILLASFLGAPIAGSVLMAINEQRLGRPKGVLTALALGFAATVVVCALAMLVPDNVPGLPISLLGIGVIRVIVQVKQADAVARHLAYGGRKGSSWAAVGIGALGLVVVLGGLVAIATGYVLVTGQELD